MASRRICATGSVTVMDNLPHGFADLAALVDGWALPTSVTRAQRRTCSTPAERAAFYDKMAPRLDAALVHLDAVELDHMDAADINLMNLCLMLAHIALAIETLGEDETSHAPHRDAMRITRSPADAVPTTKAVL